MLFRSRCFGLRTDGKVKAKPTPTDWPGLMKQGTAAAYCDMTINEFERAVASGALPMPILVNGAERRSRAAIDERVTGLSGAGDWRASQPLYRDG